MKALEATIIDLYRALDGDDEEGREDLLHQFVTALDHVERHMNTSILAVERRRGSDSG